MRVLCRLGDQDIRDAYGDVVWHHEPFEVFLDSGAPANVHPSLWRHALLNNYRGLFEVCDGAWQVWCESLGNVIFLETYTGYICIDPLMTGETTHYALNLHYQRVGKRPIVGMVYFHTYSDHFGGAKGLIANAKVAAGRCWVVTLEGFTEWVL